MSENKKEISYFDWELSFKKGNILETSGNQESEKTSTGIPGKILKDFLATWKEKNLKK